MKYESCPLLKELWEKNEELREENLQLRGMALGEGEPPQWGMTGTENIFFRKLVIGVVVTNEAIYARLYRDKVNPPGPEMVKVWLSKVRKKLREHDAPFEIETVFGIGLLLRKI